jgi:glutamate 5-kinase
MKYFSNQKIRQALYMVSRDKVHQKNRCYNKFIMTSAENIPILGVKVGTEVITSSRGKVKINKLHEIADDIAHIAKGGSFWPFFVSSGATGSGQRAYENATGQRAPLLSSPVIGNTNAEMARKQALAAIGQPKLFDTYARRLGHHRLAAAQILTTIHDFEVPERRTNMQNVFHELRKLGAIAVINENDPIATEEFRTDNDVIGELACQAFGASRLIIYSKAGGFIANNRVVATIAPDEQDHYRQFIQEPVAGDRGRGGMRSKYDSMCRLANMGVTVNLIGDRSDHRLPYVLSGAEVGTTFLPNLQSAEILT